LETRSENMGEQKITFQELKSEVSVTLKTYLKYEEEKIMG
jgi:hypothetical protein